MSDQTQKDDSQKPSQTFNIKGDIKSGYTQMGGNATFNNASFEYREGQTSQDDVRQQIQALIDQLLTVVQEEIKPQNPAKAQEILTAAEKVSQETQADEPKSERLQIRGEDLMQAAKNVADIAPTVTAIATNIVKTLVLLAQ